MNRTDSDVEAAEPMGAYSMGMWIAVGVAIGTAFGAAVEGIGIGVGIALGVGIGGAMGAAMSEWKPGEEGKNRESGHTPQT